MDRYYKDMPVMCYSCGFLDPVRTNEQTAHAVECPKCNRQRWEMLASPCKVTYKAAKQAKTLANCDSRMSVVFKSVEVLAHEAKLAKKAEQYARVKAKLAARAKRLGLTGRARIVESIAAKRVEAPVTVDMDSFIDTLPPVVVAYRPMLTRDGTEKVVGWNYPNIYTLDDHSTQTSYMATPVTPLPASVKAGIATAYEDLERKRSNRKTKHEKTMEQLTAAGMTVTIPVVEAKLVEAPTVTVTPVIDLLKATAKTVKKEDDSKAIPVDATPEQAQAIERIKELKKQIGLLEADCKVLQAMAYPWLEPLRIATCRKSSYANSIRINGSTFTSRHNWQQSLDDGECETFRAECASRGLDADRYINPMYSVDIPASTPVEQRNPIIAALSAIGLTAKVVYKTHKVIHEDYTMIPAVEATVKACERVKAVQPILYFSK